MNNNARILVVDDEPGIREVVRDILQDESYRVNVAADADAARVQLRHEPADLILLDIWMPGSDGITLLREIIEHGSDVPVVMISGHGTVETAVEAIRYGAYDFLEKPLSTAKLLVTVERALHARELQRENQALRRQIAPATRLVGRSAELEMLRDQVARIGATDSWALIIGEQGSGKGVVARMLHDSSARREQPLVDVNLAAISPENIDAQLFGREDNGEAQAGRFEEACGGTLFLNEISDLNLATQAKLVNALEEGRFIRVGGAVRINIDARVIAASNQNLDQAIRAGRFREDLYYRINVIPIQVPPLRTHREDIPDLVDYYAEWMANHDGLPYRRFTTGALNVLRNHSWPGNVRELKNVIQRILIFSHDDEVSAAEVERALGESRLAAPATDPAPGDYDTSLRDARDGFERAYFEYHLERLGGNMSELAVVSGMERTNLYRKLKGLNIDPRTRRG